MGMRNKTFRPYDLDQQFLLPPSMKDWLPANHLVYLIMDVVSSLDFSSIYTSYRSSVGGRPPYDPRMMISLLLYGYATGVRSSRKLERATYEQVPFRVITGDQQPDHDTIANFRVKHTAFLEDLFRQSVRLCAGAGLARFGHVAIDGSKVKANASKHKSMSYAHMEKFEEKLNADIAKYFADAKEIDALEDEQFGKGVRGDELPEELQTRKGRLKKIQEVKIALETEAKAAADKKRKVREDGDQQLLEAGKKPRKKQEISDKPAPHAQRNFTDPDARIMKNGATKSFEYAYNTQIAVDDTAQVIVATHVSQAPNDVLEMKPIVDQIPKVMGSGKAPDKMSADTGYFSESNVKYLEERGIDAYICTKRQKHSAKVVAAPRGRIPSNHSVKERMTRKLRTKKGKKVYSRRKAIVEPVYGQIKEVLGFRSFLLRGHKKVSGEWHLIAAVHNLLKLTRARSEIPALGLPG